MYAIFLLVAACVGYWLTKKILASKQKPISNIYEDFEYEVAIVGSGILGSALAAVLGRDGRKVVVIERDMKMPERVIGELLQPGGCRALGALGLGDCLENIDAQSVIGYVIRDHNNDKIDINYPLNAEDSPEGKAFQHGKFVMNLRNAAKKEKNVTYIEGNVTSLLDNPNAVTGVIFRAKDSSEQLTLKAKLTIVADGCFSKLRKSLVHDIPEQKSTFVGLLLNDCPQSNPKFAELILTDTSPILVYRISEHLTRLFVDIRGQKVPRDLRKYLEDTIYHQLPDHLQDPFLDAVRNGPIKNMPNGFLPPIPNYRNGAMALGDAFNMRHPLTGGGMSVAFHDIIIFRKLLLNVKDLTDYEALSRVSKRLYGGRKSSHSFVVNILSMSLYELFAANDKFSRHLQSACFQYFKRGGNCVNGPVALLSILQPKPVLFLFHFFSVAFYAIYFTFKTHPFVRLHVSLHESVCIIAKACSIICPLIWSEAKTMIL